MLITMSALTTCWKLLSGCHIGNLRATGSEFSLLNLLLPSTNRPSHLWHHCPPPVPLQHPIIREVVGILLWVVPKSAPYLPSIMHQKHNKYLLNEGSQHFNDKALQPPLLITFFRLSMSSLPFWIVSFNVLILFSFFFSWLRLYSSWILSRVFCFSNSNLV